MIRSTFAGLFLSSRARQIFLLVRKPSQPSGCVLVIPPFAEEMNKCRRMVTEVALDLCAAGQAVLVPDLYGTGDSGGDFADARWSWWEEDLATVCAWGEANGLAVTSLIGIRLGAALAISAVGNGRIPEVLTTVLWQPVLEGAKYLTQFLRLRTAAMMMTEERKESIAVLRTRLAAGESIEVAGYDLSGGLAADLENVAPPAEFPSQLGALHWMEVVRTPQSTIATASAMLVERLRTSGRRFTSQTFVGEPFWATVEIARVPEMIRGTVQSLVGIGTMSSDAL